MCLLGTFSALLGILYSHVSFLFCFILENIIEKLREQTITLENHLANLTTMKYYYLY